MIGPWIEIPFRGQMYTARLTTYGALHLSGTGITPKEWYPEAIWNPDMSTGDAKTSIIRAWCRSYLLNTADADKDTIAGVARRGALAHGATEQDDGSLDLSTMRLNQPDHNDLVELADQLGDMYPTHNSIVVAVRSVGGKPGRVRWASCGADTWRSILRAAENGAGGIDGEWVRASDYARLLEVK